ncbi:MAG TPA: hypothetical protein VJC00_01915 [Candidatus Nanoarchaeia archaeon]|nr:hypothetical protein [Candidatus Nanoarchaeia archaeon]
MARRALMLLSLIMCLIFILSSANAVLAQDEEETDEEDFIFAEWVVQGGSFDVNGKTYAVSAGATTQSAILMGPSGIYVLQETECRTIDNLKFCMEDFKYTVGGDVVVHGSDTQEFYITATEPGADMSIDRDITEDNLMIGESADVTITLMNSGEEAAVGLYYLEEIPPEFQITNSYGLEQYGNKLSWRGSLPADFEKTFSYTIQAKSRYSGKIIAKLEYKIGNITKSVTNSLALKANPLFNLGIESDKQEVDIGEETRFYAILSNMKSVASNYVIQVTVPENLEILASHFNTTEGRTLSWEGSLEDEEERTFSTAVKVLSPGTASIKATATDKSDPLNTIVEYYNITLLRSDPEIFFIRDKIIAGEKSQIKVYLKNPNPYLSITGINISVESPYFNKTASAKEFKPKEYNQILIADLEPEETGSFTISAVVSYKLKGDSYTASKQETIKIVEEEEEEPPAEPAEPNATEGTAENTTEEIEGERERKSVLPFLGKSFDFFRRYFDFFIGLFAKNEPEQQIS